MKNQRELNKLPDKINYLIFGLCVLIFIALNLGLGAKIQFEVIEILQKKTDCFFRISIDTLDYLFLAVIPFFGMIYNSMRNSFKKTELIMDILTIFLCVILISGIGLYILTFIGKPENPLIPQYILTEPFSLYSTLLIGIGILVPFLISTLIKKH